MPNRRIAAYISAGLLVLGAANLFAETRVDVHEDIRVIAIGVREFQFVCGRLPTNEEGLKALIERPPNVAAWRQTLVEIPLDPWSHPYQYRLAPERPLGFDVFSLGRDPKDSSDDVHYESRQPSNHAMERTSDRRTLDSLR
ncbi:MAG: hypothetical protein DMF06_09335 [Verrucomicrobia bacterium]|nr:MAG: hypothetical protein DMF06_09335 [Verrucomicrobiota bacterium]